MNLTRYWPWTLPLVMPFIMIGLIRAAWWAAGAQIVHPDAVALFSLIFGVPIGVAIAAFISEPRHD